MTYYVVAPDGQKYGPGDVMTLNEWARLGRIVPTTIIEDAATGGRMAAAQVPGILFQQNPQSSNSAFQPNIQQYPRTGFVSDTGRGDYQLAMVFGVLAIVVSPPMICCTPLIVGPVLFSSLGIYFASLAQRKGFPNHRTAMTLNIVALVIAILVGVVFQVLMSSQLRQFR
jgi:hypothetical protein